MNAPEYIGALERPHVAVPEEPSAPYLLALLERLTAVVGQHQRDGNDHHLLERIYEAEGL